MQIINVTKNVVIADKAEIADSFLKRTVGLLGRSRLPKGEALLLKNASSIHTFFMRFPIDVLFINRKNVVVKIFSDMRPFRLSSIHLFCDAIELPAGTIQATSTQEGDILQIN